MMDIYIPGYGREKTRRAFRNLLKQITFTDQNYKTIAVISSGEEKTRTQVAANLAAGIADRGKRCMIIAADPKGAKSLIPKGSGPIIAGLEECLSGSREYKECIQDTQYERLDILVANDEKSDLAEGETFRELISAVSDQYDCLIIDLPPIDRDLGSIIIAGYCDAGILVAHGPVQLQPMQKTLKILSENSHLLGMIRV